MVVFKALADSPFSLKNEKVIFVLSFHIFSLILQKISILVIINHYETFGKI